MYLRGGLPVSPRAYPYLSLGYTWLEISVSSHGVAEEERVEDASFGLGLDFSFSANIAFNIEYQQYINEAPLEVKGASWGFSYRY